MPYFTSLVPAGRKFRSEPVYEASNGRYESHSKGRKVGVIGCGKNTLLFEHQRKIENIFVHCTVFMYTCAVSTIGKLILQENAL